MEAAWAEGALHAAAKRAYPGRYAGSVGDRHVFRSHRCAVHLGGDSTPPFVVFFGRGESELAGEIDLAARKLARTVPLPKS